MNNFNSSNTHTSHISITYIVELHETSICIGVLTSATTLVPTVEHLNVLGALLVTSVAPPTTTTTPPPPRLGYGVGNLRS